MANIEAYYTNELGRITIRNPIIGQAVVPELSVENKFRPAGKVRNFVDVEATEEGRVNIEVHLAVAYGVNIKEEAPKIQQQIKRSVETITGLSVGDVSIHIDQLFSQPAVAPKVAP